MIAFNSFLILIVDKQKRHNWKNSRAFRREPTSVYMKPAGLQVFINQFEKKKINRLDSNLFI